jgi:hypothetical protein
VSNGTGWAQQAIQALNGHQIDGRSLTVNEAKPRENRGRAAGAVAARAAVAVVAAAVVAAAATAAAGATNAAGPAPLSRRSLGWGAAER